MVELQVAPPVAAALADGRAVVALESSLLVHGLPPADALATAVELEACVRAEGAEPATVGVVGGTPVIGLSPQQLERLVRGTAQKLSVRDLPLAVAAGADGATTVASTAHLAVRAGVRVFATGGLGGVHRQARETWDESADLAALARTPVLVVCSGVKSILDVPATLERLESLGVPVAGYRTRRFPGFYLTDAGHPLDWQLDSPAEVAAVLRVMDGLALADRALILANPVPADEQLDPRLHDAVLDEALAAAERAGLRGKAVTPFLLARLHEGTGGASLRTNVALVRHNARLAARVAVVVREQAAQGWPS